MGQVFRALDTRLDREVALKFLFNFDPVPINPDLEESVPTSDPPIYGCVKFTWRGREYLFDQVRPHLREALGIGASKPSEGARYLRACLWLEPTDFRVELAFPRILWLAKRIRV
jgi:hypothetical protein